MQGCAGRAHEVVDVVGPGQVLTGLIKRIAPDATVISLDDPAAPDRLAVPFKE